MNIEKSTYKELCDLILNDKNGKPGRRDLIIPVLDDYVSICKKYDKHCVIELKNRLTYNDIKEIVKTVELYEYLDNTTFISFDINNLIVLSSYRMQYAHITNCADGRFMLSLPDGTTENLSLSDFEGGLLVLEGKYGEKHSFSEAENYMGSGETAIIFSSAGFHQSIIVYK